MTTKERILRDAMALRESIRLDLIELANKSWTDADRGQILGSAALCALELQELIKRLSSAG